MNIENFKDEVNQRIESQASNQGLKEAANRFLLQSVESKYSYNFNWLGRPIIQYPQDIVAVQEILWRVQPDLIIETGIAHGGSLILSASMLELNAACGGYGDARVIGVDIEIRSHNRKAIEEHPLSHRIRMIEGSSISEEVVAQIAVEASKASRVVVMLDSNHTGDHVLKELKLYSRFVNSGGYIIVFDTIIEDLTRNEIGERPWAPGNSPKSAVQEFLKSNDRFSIDKEMESKLLITVAPDGYLVCRRNP